MHICMLSANNKQGNYFSMQNVTLAWLRSTSTLRQCVCACVFIIYFFFINAFDLLCGWRTCVCLYFFRNYLYVSPAITIRVEKRKKKKFKKKTYNNTKAIQYFIELKQNEKEKQCNNESNAKAIEKNVREKERQSEKTYIHTHTHTPMW